MAQPAKLHSKTQQSSRVLHPPVGQSLDRWRAFEHNYSVGQIGRHDKVVFHHKSRLLGVKDKSEQRRMDQVNSSSIDVLHHLLISTELPSVPQFPYPWWTLVKS